MFHNDPPRNVRVRLSVIDDANGKKIIVSALESVAQNTFFKQEDERPLIKGKLQSAQNDSKKNKDDKDNKGKTIQRGERVHADDYDPKDEPKYDHAGIHLRFNDQDQIIWFTDDDLTFTIHTGPDPELYLAQRTIPSNEKFPKKKDLHDPALSSFRNATFTCSKGVDAPSGPLLTDANKQRVEDQRYFKFSTETTVPGSGHITADPHYEGHDD